MVGVEKTCCDRTWFAIADLFAVDLDDRCNFQARARGKGFVCCQCKFRREGFFNDGIAELWNDFFNKNRARNTL